jgi:hypothetical protein
MEAGKIKEAGNMAHRPVSVWSHASLRTWLLPGNDWYSSRPDSADVTRDNLGNMHIKRRAGLEIHA